jgi:hypothetical protein
LLEGQFKEKRKEHAVGNGKDFFKPTRSNGFNSEETWSFHIKKSTQNGKKASFRYN